jgi:phage shock protein E
MKQMIIDTREPDEYAQSHVDGAVNISASTFAADGLPAQLQGVAKDQSIIVYCRSGARSNTVMHILHDHGFTDITNGINEGQVRAQLAKAG